MLPKNNKILPLLSIFFHLSTVDIKKNIIIDYHEFGEGKLGILAAVTK